LRTIKIKIHAIKDRTTREYQTPSITIDLAPNISKVQIGIIAQNAGKSFNAILIDSKAHHNRQICSISKKFSSDHDPTNWIGQQPIMSRCLGEKKAHT